MKEDLAGRELPGPGRSRRQQNAHSDPALLTNRSGTSGSGSSNPPLSMQSAHSRCGRGAAFQAFISCGVSGRLVGAPRHPWLRVAAGLRLLVLVGLVVLVALVGHLDQVR